MIHRIESYMIQHHMIKKGDHICVGVSGGADSVCLFRILEALRRRMGFTMSVVHIEHGIRGTDSLTDMEFVQQLAKTYEIPVSVYAYPVKDIAAKQRLSVEEAGRNVRKKAYEEEMARFGAETKVALAHHADDNAETLLFHMCRGSGIEGVSGIYPMRGNFIRPLLCVTRREIEAYLKKEGQAYRTDVTNADNRYSRNRIRNCIMPEILRLNEQSVAHMNALSEDMREVSEYISVKAAEVIKKYGSRTKENAIKIPVDCLSDYPPVLKKRVLLELLAELSGSKKDLSREHADALLDLAGGQTGRRLSLPYGITAEKIYGDLVCCFEKDRQRNAPVTEKIELKEYPAEFDVSGGKFLCRILSENKKDVNFPKNLYTKWFDYDKIKNMLCFRSRESGDYMVIDQKGHRQKLKDYLVNEKVPRKQRDKILLLADGSHILWVVGGRMSEYYKITEQTRQILEVHYVEGKA